MNKQLSALRTCLYFKPVSLQCVMRVVESTAKVTTEIFILRNIDFVHSVLGYAECSIYLSCINVVDINFYCRSAIYCVTE